MINSDPGDRAHNYDDPRADRSPRLFTRITQLPDLLVVILQRIPDSNEAASREHRQTKLVQQYAVVHDHLTNLILSLFWTLVDLATYDLDA